MRDLVGQTFGRLVVLRRVGSARHKGIQWECLCSCGNIISVYSTRLVSKKTQSCGCIRREKTIQRSYRGPNEVDIVGSIAKLYLTDVCGNTVGVVLLDKEDVDVVAEYRWCMKKSLHTNYAYIRRRGLKTIYMHRLVLALDNPRVHVDHVNRNGLDNRRSNLRLATPSENLANSRCSGGDSSYRGVRMIRKDSWTSRITKDGKEIHIGCFTTPEDAALAYNKKAKELFGEFATLNVVCQGKNIILPRVSDISSKTRLESKTSRIRKVR